VSPARGSESIGLADAPPSKVLVSIIIPTRNRRAEVLRCLASLPLERGDVEAIVVDDGSSDGTANEVNARHPRVRVMVNPASVGPGCARNQAIVQSNGRYVLFLDSDAALRNPATMDRMVSALEHDPGIGAIGGEIRARSGAERAYGRTITWNGDSRAVAASARDEACLADCDFLATCCCMVTRELAARVGGFDPYYGFGAEDKDFGCRIARAGYRNCFATSCAAVHAPCPRGRDADETYRYHLTRVRFVLKNLSPFNVLCAAGLDLARVVAFYPLLPLKLAWKLLRGARVRTENFTAPLLILRAYLWNLRRLGHTRSCRTRDFLSPDEMDEFRQWRTAGAGPRARAHTS